MFDDVPKLQPIKNKRTAPKTITTAGAAAPPAAKEASKGNVNNNSSGGGGGGNANWANGNNRGRGNLSGYRSNFKDSNNGTVKTIETNIGEPGRPPSRNYQPNQPNNYYSNQYQPYYRRNNYSNYSQDRNYHRFRYQRNNQNFPVTRGSPEEYRGSRNQFNSREFRFFEEVDPERKDITTDIDRRTNQEKSSKGETNANKEEVRKESNFKTHDKQQEKTVSNLSEYNKKRNAYKSNEKRKDGELKPPTQRDKEKVPLKAKGKETDKDKVKEGENKPKEQNKEREKEKEKDKDKAKDQPIAKHSGSKETKKSNACEDRGTSFKKKPIPTAPKKIISKPEPSQKQKLIAVPQLENTELAQKESTEPKPEPKITEETSTEPAVTEKGKKELQQRESTEPTPEPKITEETPTEPAVTVEKALETLSVVQEVSEILPTEQQAEAEKLPTAPSTQPKISIIPYSKLVRAEFCDLAEQLFSEEESPAKENQSKSPNKSSSDSSVTEALLTAATNVKPSKYKPNLVQRKRNFSGSSQTGTTTSPPYNSQTTTAHNSPTASSSTADIVNKVVSMSSAGIKQIINSTGSKYEQALQIEARKHLQEEIRKQLKSLAMQEPRFSTNTVTTVTEVAPDAFVDAMQIPPMLLEQIRQLFSDEVFPEQVLSIAGQTTASTGSFSAQQTQSTELLTVIHSTVSSSIDNNSSNENNSNNDNNSSSNNNNNNSSNNNNNSTTVQDKNCEQVQQQPKLTLHSPSQSTLPEANPLMSRIQTAELIKKSPPHRKSPSSNRRDEPLKSPRSLSTIGRRSSTSPRNSPHSIKKNKRSKKKDEPSSRNSSSQNDSSTSDTDSDTTQSSSSSSFKRMRFMRQKRDAENIINTFEKLLLPTLRESQINHYRNKFNGTIANKLHFISLICTSEYNSTKFSKSEVAKIQRSLNSKDKDMALDFLTREIIHVLSYQKELKQLKELEHEAEMAAKQKRKEEAERCNDSSIANRIASITTTTTITKTVATATMEDVDENVINIEEHQSQSAKNANAAENLRQAMTAEKGDVDDVVTAKNVGEGVESNKADNVNNEQVKMNEAAASCAYKAYGERVMTLPQSSSTLNQINADTAYPLAKPMQNVTANIRPPPPATSEMNALNPLQCSSTAAATCYNMPNSLTANLGTLMTGSSLNNPLNALTLQSSFPSSFTEQNVFHSVAFEDADVNKLNIIEMELMDLQKRKMFLEEMILKFQKDKMDVEMRAMQLQNDKFLLLNKAMSAKVQSMSNCSAAANSSPISATTITSSTMPGAAKNETNVLTTTMAAQRPAIVTAMSTATNTQSQLQPSLNHATNISTTASQTAEIENCTATAPSASSAKNAKLNSPATQSKQVKRKANNTPTPRTPPSRKSKRLSLQQQLIAAVTAPEEDEEFLVVSTETVAPSSDNNIVQQSTLAETQSNDNSNQSSTSEDSNVDLSDLPTGELQSFTSPITHIRAFDKYIYAASEKGQLHKINMCTLEREASVERHNDAITFLYICPERRVIYTTSLDGYLKQTDIEHLDTDIEALHLKEPLQVIDVAWETAFIGSRKGHVMTYSVETNKIAEGFLCSTGTSITALKATKEGPRRILMISSKGNVIHFRDAKTGLLLRTLEIPDNLNILSLLLDDSAIYCGTQRNEIFKFDFTTGSRSDAFKCGNGAIALKMYRNKYLFVGCYDGFIYIVNKETGQQLAKFVGSGKMVLALEIAGNRIITSSKDNTMKIVEIPI